MNDVSTVPLPEFLTRLLKAPAVVSAKSPEYWRSYIADGADSGNRNAYLTGVTGHFLRRYIDPLVVLETMHCINAQKCRPPLDENEVVQIVGSVSSIELERRRKPGNE